MSISDDQLRWVQENHQPYDRTVGLGKLADKVIGERTISLARQNSELQGLIAAYTDDDFQEHCTLGKIAAGRASILVDDPSQLAGMSDRWRMILLDRIKENCKGVRITGLNFRNGTSDLRFSQPGLDTSRVGSAKHEKMTKQP